MTAVIIQRRIERDEAQLATTKNLLRIAKDSGEHYHARLFALDISHAEGRLALHREELQRQRERAAQ